MEHFDELKELFLLDFNNAVEMDKVPTELVINWDKTRINYLPISSWMMEQEGTKGVEVIGKDDKQQLTALFACSMSEDFPQSNWYIRVKQSNVYPSSSFPMIGISLIPAITSAMSTQCISIFTR